MHDARLALRQLLRRPQSAALAVLTIGLALGATVGVGTIVDHAVLRPLPYPEPDRLMVVWNTYPRWREREVLSRFWDRIDLAWTEYAALRAQRSVFREVAIFRADDAVFGDQSDGARPEVILAGSATHGLLDVLQVGPSIGRWFAPDEDRQGAAPVAVLRHEFWQSRLGGDPSVVGRVITLDGQGVSVIGVLPRGFRFRRAEDLRPPDLWMPLGRIADPNDAGDHSFVSVARLHDGVSREQALAASVSVLRGERRPEVRGARIMSRNDYERGGSRPMLLLFAGAVAVLLLLACATVAAMQLTRITQRDREVAMRVALGASRGRIARQLLAENAVLGLAGGVLGVALATLTIGALIRLMPAGTPGLDVARLDLRLLAVAAALSLFTGVIFGTAPLLRAARRDPAEALRGTQATRGGGALLGLVGVQSALAVLLLAGAALLVQTVRALGNVDPGYAVEQRLTFVVTLPGDRYPAERRQAWWRDFRAQVAALPSVTGVDATSVLPLSGNSNSNSIWLASLGPEAGRVKPEAERRIVSPGYFENLGIPLLRGRSFTSSDNEAAAPVMLVSRSAAERLWPGRNPIGDRVELDDRWWTVIGIVDDVRDRSLAAVPVTTIYVATTQWPRLSHSFIVRTLLPPEQLIPPIRGIVSALDPEVPLRDPRSFEQVRAAATQPERARATLLGAYALLATLLALAGLYGVTSHMATQGAREIGIRVALGARLRDVLQLVMRRTLTATLAGGVVGVLLAIACTRLLRRFLYGVHPSDPLVLATVVASLTLFAIAIGAVPALRTALRPPTDALRKD